MNAKEIIERTKQFALNTINLSQKLPDTFLGKHIKRQLIRSSTSVAANYRATRLAQSSAAFVAKLSIVIEEVDESAFWIELAQELNLLSPQESNSTHQEAKELTAIFISTRKSMNKKRAR